MPAALRRVLGRARSGREHARATPGATPVTFDGSLLKGKLSALVNRLDSGCLELPALYVPTCFIQNRAASSTTELRKKNEL
jgi:hypothetical protein